MAVGDVLKSNSNQNLIPLHMAWAVAASQEPLLATAR
jgi:hypothetical protein